MSEQTHKIEQVSPASAKWRVIALIGPNVSLDQSVDTMTERLQDFDLAIAISDMPANDTLKSYPDKKKTGHYFDYITTATNRQEAVREGMYQILTALGKVGLSEVPLLRALAGTGKTLADKPFADAFWETYDATDIAKDAEWDFHPIPDHITFDDFQNIKAK